MQDVTNEGRRGITTPLSAESVTSATDGKHLRPELVLRRSIPSLRTPYQRSLAASRPHAHKLGVGVARSTFSVTDLHRLPSAGLPAHPSTASIPNSLMHRGKFRSS